jgi:hypothetical protein
MPTDLGAGGGALEVGSEDLSGLEPAKEKRQSGKEQEQSERKEEGRKASITQDQDKIRTNEHSREKRLKFTLRGRLLIGTGNSPYCEITFDQRKRTNVISDELA